MTSNTNYEKYLLVAKEAAKVAEQITNSYYKGNLCTEIKSDKSPVTIADKEAESAIKEIIRKHFPDHSFLGEEGGTENLSSEFMWIVDPIDGTKNYTRGIPLFATQIALMHKDEVVIGLSMAPQIGELVTATKGGGAMLNGKSIHVSSVDKIENAFLTFGSLKYFHKTGLAENILNIAKRAYYARGIGDAWSYHLLARGAMDIMIEAETKIWDISAVSLIIEESGGKVTDIAGKKISRETTSLIATNGHLHKDVVSLFSQS